MVAGSYPFLDHGLSWLPIYGGSAVRTRHHDINANRPEMNGKIEGFSSRLWAEFLNAEVFHLLPRHPRDLQGRGRSVT